MITRTNASLWLGWKVPGVGHSRHIFINSEVLKNCDEALCIVMQREELVPEAPQDIPAHDKELFDLHFANRKAVEDATYSSMDHRMISDRFETIFVQPHELNSPKIASTVEKFDADLAFVFGVDMIKDPVLSKLPDNKVNLHLGLSPWYKGGATLFWPFYFLQPQLAGITLHQITDKPDAGRIIHQSVPVMEYGDKIHDVGAKCVVQARMDVDQLFRHWRKNGSFGGKVQKTTGRVWRGVDFQPAHLRVIYDLYQDSIVDAYLSGELEQRLPKLITSLDD